MKAGLRAFAALCIGLVVDDGTLAIGLLVWCVAIAVALWLAPDLPSLGSGVLLALGCIVILLANVARAASAPAARRR